MATGDHVARGSKHLRATPSISSKNTDLEALRQDALDASWRPEPGASTSAALDGGTGATSGRTADSDAAGPDSDDVFVTAPATPVMSPSVSIDAQ